MVFNSPKVLQALVKAVTNPTPGEVNSDCINLI